MPQVYALRGYNILNDWQGRNSGSWSFWFSSTQAILIVAEGGIAEHVGSGDALAELAAVEPLTRMYWCPPRTADPTYVVQCDMNLWLVLQVMRHFYQSLEIPILFRLSSLS